MRLCPHPEPWHHFPIEGAPNLLQRFNLLSSCTLVSLFHLLHSIEVKDPSRVIKVHPHYRALRDALYLCVVAVVPGVVAGAAPADAPGLLVFPQAAGSFAVPPCCPLVCGPDHDPSWELHLPVASEAQDAFFAKNLVERGWECNLLHNMT